jgi:hypothetical protein
MIIRYAARCKEIWIYEKYRREKSIKKSESFRINYYAALCKDVNDLVMELENTEFVDSELLECREQYLNAGRALEKAFECQKRGDPLDESMKEYLYYMDNGASELTRLWKEYGKAERRNR